MKLLFDQNISHRILQYLPAELHAATIKSEGLINASDRTIWDFALKNEFIIVTQDSDFNDLNLLYGFPPKLIWIRLGNLKNKELADLLISHADEIGRFALDKNLGCFEIVRYKL